MVTQSTNATIFWQPTYDGNEPITGGVIFVQEFHSTESYHTYKFQSRHLEEGMVYESVKGLKPYTMYSFSIAASNIVGESVKSVPISQTTKQDSKWDVDDFYLKGK